MKVFPLVQNFRRSRRQVRRLLFCGGNYRPPVFFPYGRSLCLDSGDRVSGLVVDPADPG